MHIEHLYATEWEKITYSNFFSSQNDTQMGLGVKNKFNDVHLEKNFKYIVQWFYLFILHLITYVYIL
jgi:cytochrome oxidase assembly protein ShyY1